MRGIMPTRAILWILAFSFALPLALYVAKGTLIRMSDDDYCYAGLVKQVGFLKAQAVSYNEITGYNGNRFSLTFLMGIMSSMAPKSFGLLPGLSIVIWLGTIIFVAGQLKVISDSRVEGVAILVFAEALLFFTLYRAPNLTQVLFWAAGLAPYLAPLIFNTALLGILLYTSRLEEMGWGWFPLVALVACIGGGFSETMATTQLLWLLLFFLVMVAKKSKNRSYLLLVGVALAGSALGLILLAASPSIDRRLAIHSHPSLLAVGLRSLGYGIDFVVGLTKSSYLPAFMSVALAFLLGLIVRVPRISQVPLRTFVIGFLLTGVVGFLLITASIAPSVYAQSAYPGERALFPAGYIVVFTMMALAWALGQRLGDSVRGPVIYIVLASCLIVSVYPLHAANSISGTIPKFVIWQTLWDLRDDQIRDLEKQGIMDLEVLKIDLNPYYDQDVINDLGANSESRYNRCAAQYYGVDSISANIYPPGGRIP